MAEVQLNFGAGLLKVSHSGPVEDIISFIETNGYGAHPVNTDSPVGPDSKLRLKLYLAVISGVFLGMGLLLDWTNYSNISPYFFAISMVTGGHYVYRSAVNSLAGKVLDMNVLMTISSIGAVLIGEWSEAAAVVFLFSVGNMLQAFTLEKTRSSISKMMEMSPREARVLSPNGVEQMVSISEVKVGDMVLVKPGEYIPVDGIVAEGFSWVNQAPITGESKPVEKTADDGVFAGTVNNEGILKVVVKHIASDSTLAKMIDMVEEAQSRKAPFQQLVDVFTRYYTPAVIVGAVLLVLVPVLLFNMSFSEWFYKALVLLVISCPCALVISTPVSIVSAIGNAARNGVLIKGGAYLEALGRVQSIAFDKTGTVTTGQLRVTGIFPVPGLPEEKLITLAGSVESYSQHPIAGAILKEAEQRKIALPDCKDFVSYPGKGARGRTNGRVLYVGNKRLMEELGVLGNQAAEWEKASEESGHSLIYAAFDDEFLGVISVADIPRQGVEKVFDRLRDMGVREMVMLSGDNQATVSRVASEIGIESYNAELLPEDKVRRVEELSEKGVTVMVGDGVNDAPALAVSTVGIAMGAAGADSALETADVALMNDELDKIPSVIQIGRKTLSIIKQNIVLAIGLKLVFLVLTIAGISNLWMAVFADTGASILVTLNGMRLARFKFSS